MAQAFLVGRILIGCYYIQNAYKLLTQVGPMARAAAAHGMPAAEPAVVVAGLLVLVAGLSFLFGVFPRLGVAALVAFLVPVTLVMHPFWAERDLALRQNDVAHFMKNVALLGSSLMFLAVPRPWPYSLERHLRLPVRAPV